MNQQDKSARDAFAFSLGGLSTVAAVTLAPAIADDTLRQVNTKQLQMQKQERAARPWLFFFDQAAYFPSV